MDIGPTELIIILVIVVLVFGPGRLANVGRELGESIRQFRQGMDTKPEAEQPDEPTES